MRPRHLLPERPRHAPVGAPGRTLPTAACRGGNCQAGFSQHAAVWHPPTKEGTEPSHSQLLSTAPEACAEFPDHQHSAQGLAEG